MPAKAIYRSVWFEKARRYVERQRQPWFILSAKYGLLRPEQIVAPYEQTLNRMSATERRRRASLVLEELRAAVSAGDEVAFLAGARYREYLQSALEAWGVSVNIPMKGLGIGSQLHWLDSHS